ncbi:MAG: hypothetical protein M0D55_02085 [Elusimicrobiota bacterium]|nr:MAG: hypothetical protein M0D55_02085 [Elusimicrobiota bacterium]
MTTAAAPAASNPALAFIPKAEAFAAAHRGDAAFRFLRLFLRASEDELDLVMKKLYCDALPQVNYQAEPLWRVALDSALHPFFYALKKSWLWSPEPAVVVQIETIDLAYFRKWFSRAFEGFSGTKRVSPRGALPEYPSTGPVEGSIVPGVLPWLAVAPLFIPSLWLLSRRHGLNLLKSYRRCLGMYAVYEGHFRRWPCRHFVTYADELNHPSRWLAFKHNCSGSLVVVQNGERGIHPFYAYSAMDVYLTFGDFCATMLAPLRMRVGRLHAVGALCLDEQHERVRALERAGEPIAWDVLMVDQGVWPHCGLDLRTARSFEAMFRNLNELKKRNPALRVAYQLRPYAEGSVQGRDTLALIKTFFTDGVEILPNNGNGDSYVSLYKSRLAITFNSTLGYEAFFIRRGLKALFVNYAGNPYENYSADERFQLTDEAADYGRYERRVLELLDLELAEPPAVARERHAHFDGRAQQRIAEFVNALGDGRAA